MPQSKSIDPLAGARFIMLGGPSPHLDRLADAISGTGRAVDRIANPTDLIEASGPAIVIEALQQSTDLRARALHRLEHLLTGDHLLVSLASPVVREPLGSFLHGRSRHCTLSDCDAFGFPDFAEIGIDPDRPAASIQGFADLLQSAGLASIGVRHTSFTEKIALAYMLEGLALLGEGVSAALIEETALQAGMHSGPLAMIDRYSLAHIDHLLHASESASGHRTDQSHDHHHHDHDHHHAHDHDHGHHHAHPHDHEHDHGHGHHQEPAPALMTGDAIYVLEKMAHGFRRPGLQDGKGFYEYDDGDEPELWSGLKVFERRRNLTSESDIRDRLLHAQSLEARRCLALGIVTSATDADRASILGLGFPAQEGGVIARCNRDLPAFLARATDLAARFGARFAP